MGLPIEEKCVAFVEGPSLCKNGFPQSIACQGRVCHSCGQHTAKIPSCMNEDIHKAWINEDGTPKYYRKGQP